MCPDLEPVVRSFIVMVKGGCDQLMYILLIIGKGVSSIRILVPTILGSIYFG